MNKRLRICLVAAGGGALGLALWLWGCTKGKGVYPDNIPPVISFVNIPPESTYYSQSPTIYWYATDLDGFITQYQYTIVPTARLMADVLGIDSTTADSILRTTGLTTDSLYRLAAREVSRVVANPPRWTVVDNINANGSRVAVKLVSLPNGVFVDQVLFLRAFDNFNPPASTPVLYRRYYRNNHPPNTSIEARSDTLFFDRIDTTVVNYCLPETTATWKGINIGWVGSDDIDFPKGGAPLDFSWELYGPFAAKQDAKIDAGKKLDSSYNATTQDPWVTATTRRFVNLQTGWYFFVVRSRDDALVPDTTPATGRFRIIRPTFERPMLLLTYDNRLNPLIQDFGNINAADSALVRNFYYRLLSGSGYLWDAGTDHFVVKRAEGNDSIAFFEEKLSHYQLVVLLYEGIKEPYLNATWTKLFTYLDAGGKVWAMGRNILQYPFEGPFTVPTLKCTDLKTGKPFTYFNLECQYYATSINLGLPGAGKPVNNQFVGAGSLRSELPGLSVDLAKLFRYGTRTAGGRVMWDSTRMPDVNYDQRGTKATPLYVFQVPVAFADTSHLGGTVVAVRYNGPPWQGKPIFKTAHFGFPLYVLDDSGGQVQAMVTEMLRWFLNPAAIP